MPSRRIRSARRLLSWWRQMAFSSQVLIMGCLYRKNWVNGHPPSEVISRYSSQVCTGMMKAAGAFETEDSRDSRPGESMPATSRDISMKLTRNSQYPLTGYPESERWAARHMEKRARWERRGNGQKLLSLSALP